MEGCESLESRLCAEEEHADGEAAEATPFRVSELNRRSPVCSERAQEMSRVRVKDEHWSS